MPILLTVIFISMICLYYVRKWDLIREWGIGNWTLPGWAIFAPVVFPVFLLGLGVLFVYLVLRSFYRNL